VKRLSHPPRDAAVIRYSKNEDPLSVEHSHLLCVPLRRYKKANPVRGSLFLVSSFETGY
jgi:hypothetical protein